MANLTDAKSETSPLPGSLESAASRVLDEWGRSTCSCTMLVVSDPDTWIACSTPYSR